MCRKASKATRKTTAAKGSRKTRSHKAGKRSRKPHTARSTTCAADRH